MEVEQVSALGKKTKQNKPQQKKTLKDTRRTVSRMPKHEAAIRHKASHVGRDVRHRDRTKRVANAAFSPADGKKQADGNGKTHKLKCCDQTARLETGRDGGVVLFSRSCIRYKKIYLFVLFCVIKNFQTVMLWL